MLDFEKKLIDERILVTGSTGFTGGWVCAWMEMLNIKIFGFGLSPDTDPSLFNTLNISQFFPNYIGNIENFNEFHSVVERFQPTLILHLAAQPLVRKSFACPLQTFQTNALGTANVLESARIAPSVKGVLCITTDKVYSTRFGVSAFNEDDRIGGEDPYSASKAAAEMVIDGYKSVARQNNNRPAIAVARGGNIFGGGDWAEDRLIPDIIRSIIAQRTLKLRYPNAVRPWQHVLALVSGYMQILAGLASENTANYDRAWNLGPNLVEQISVIDIVKIFETFWEPVKIETEVANLPESTALLLDSSYAKRKLFYSATWDLRYSLEKTAYWYRSFYDNPTKIHSITLEQIHDWRRSLA